MQRILATLVVGTLLLPALGAAGDALPAAVSVARVTPERSVTAPSPAPRQPILDQDARLERRVTLRLKKSPLADIAAALGREAGVEMKAAPGVADEPAIVFAAEQPAREIMHHLARLFGYRWTRRGTPGQYRYELFQDLASGQAEEALRLMRQRRAFEGLQRVLRQRLDLAQRSPEALRREAETHEAALRQWEQLPKELRVRATETPKVQALAPHAARSYELREMADPFRRALVRVATTLTPAQWSTLLSGEPLQFATRARPGTLPLPPTLAGPLRTARPSLLPPGAHVGFASPEEEALFRQQEQKAQERWAQAESLSVRVQLAVTTAPGSAQAVLTVTPSAQMPAGFGGGAPPAPQLIVVGQRLPLEEEEGPADPRGVPAEAHKPAVEASLSASRRSPAAMQNDPVLGAQRPFRVELTPAGKGPVEPITVNELLATIAETYGINLVADAYRAEPLSLPDLTALQASAGAGAEARAYRLCELLDRYVSPSARWSREDGFVHVRRQAWFHDRLAEIPARVAKQWAVSLRQTGPVSLEEAARLVATLRDEQLEQFEAVMNEQGIGVMLSFDDAGADAGKRQRAILRAYAHLLPAQRSALRAGGAVAGAAMPDDARRWLRAALATPDPEAKTLAAAEIVLTLGQAITDADAGDMPGAAAEEAPDPAAGAPAPTERKPILQVEFRCHSQDGQVVAIPVALPQVDVGAAPARAGR
jgi:hypothetical protein